MMTLSPIAVSEIKASAGIYRASDVARHYGVHRSTVGRIWDGDIRAGIEPASDFPDIPTPLRDEELWEEVTALLERGLSVDEAATALGVSKRFIYKVRAAKVGIF